MLNKIFRVQNGCVMGASISHKGYLDSLCRIQIHFAHKLLPQKTYPQTAPKQALITTSQQHYTTANKMGMTQTSHPLKAIDNKSIRLVHSLLDSYCNSNSCTYHRVVTHTEEAHHLNVCWY